MIDPITEYIIEQDSIIQSMKKAGKCDWKCDRILKMHEKRAAILLGGLVSMPGAIGSMLLYQLFSKSGVLNNYCMNSCMIKWVKQRAQQNKDNPEKYKKYLTKLKSLQQSRKVLEIKIKNRIEKYRMTGKDKAHQFMKASYDKLKGM